MVARIRQLLLCPAMALLPMAPAAAAESGAHPDGAALSLWWGLPFAGLLLSIAVLPQLTPRFWHLHFGKLAAAWALALLLPFAAAYGIGFAATKVLHALLLEYLPFVVLLFALFVISGGIRIRSNLPGTPAVNTALLAFGTGIASVVGTTGAAMLLVRPLIQANHKRRRNAHVLVFFIFLVGNIGGALTPLGDPPLFLGFLQGVPFTWTLVHMSAPMLVCALLLLAEFYVLDRLLWARDGAPGQRERLRIGFRGLHNAVYLAAAVGAVLLSGTWQPDIALHVAGVALPLPGVLRDGVLLVLAALSWATTDRRVRIENAFSWTPILEVVYLFAGIFITITPVLAILQAGHAGALAPVLALTERSGRPDPAAYFWLTGVLSAFLDNAPTYLVFFNMAGGDAQALAGPLSRTLLAISAGAVFMGALTYLGNAPNFLVRSIASERGIRMPSFFGFLGYAALALLPVFGLLTLLFFHSA